MTTLNIETIPYKKAEYKNNELIRGPIASKCMVKLSGDIIDEVFVNTIKRVILEYVPCYAYSREDIEIYKNTSIFNNDEIIERLSLLPIYDINHNVVYLTDEELDKKKKNNDDNYEINCYLNVVNNSKTNILDVTTDDLKMIINTKEMNVYKNYDPILLVKLKPEQQIELSMKASISIPKKHVTWSSCSNVYYREEKGKYILTIKSRNQISEKKILQRACKITKKLLLKYELNIKGMEDETYDDYIHLKFNENHTLLYLINHLLQDHEDILFSGINRTSFLCNKMEMKIKSKKGFEPIYTVINIINNKIDEIEKKLNHIM